MVTDNFVNNRIKRLIELDYIEEKLLTTQRCTITSYEKIDFIRISL